MMNKLVIVLGVILLLGAGTYFIAGHKTTPTQTTMTPSPTAVMKQETKSPQTFNDLIGMNRSVGKTFATDFVEPERRASGVGWYSTAIGLSSLLASIIAGQLWDKVGHSAVFIYGVLSGVIGIIALSLFTP